MALPTTEIAVMPLKAGAVVEDPSSSAGQAFQYMMTTVSKQEGFQRICWGRRIEKESDLQFLIGKFLLVPRPRSMQGRLAYCAPRLGLDRCAQEVHG